MAEYDHFHPECCQEQFQSKFIPPSNMLQGLLNFKSQRCRCCEQNEEQIENNSHCNLSALENSITILQKKIDAMNHQVIEVQGLLTQRDMLYNQLDNLKAQRQEIQDHLQQQQIEQETTIKKKKGGRGVRQMNERLRRRIKQVKEYIQKMEIENEKIEQNMSREEHRSFYSQNMGRKNPNIGQGTNYQLYSDYYSPSHRIQKGVQNKFNHQYFQGIRKRLHQKEKEAWQRIKRQQEQIQQRNARSMINFGRGIYPENTCYIKTATNNMYNPYRYNNKSRVYRGVYPQY